MLIFSVTIKSVIPAGFKTSFVIVFSIILSLFQSLKAPPPALRATPASGG